MGQRQSVNLDDHEITHIGYLHACMYVQCHVSPIVLLYNNNLHCYNMQCTFIAIYIISKYLGLYLSSNRYAHIYIIQSCMNTLRDRLCASCDS